MNALFSCLYSIPFFQSTVYEIINELPELPPINESVLMSLADIFVKMRTNKTAVGLSNTMFRAFKREMNWTVGGYRCVLEFWTSFVNKMPEKFQDLCKLQLKSNFYRKSDGVLIKSVVQTTNYIDIPTSNQPIVLSQFVESNFLDMEPEDFTIEVDSQDEYPHILSERITEKVKIPMVNTMTIENAPNVLIFNVKRQGWDRESGEVVLNSVPIHFDNIVINNEVYGPCCALIYDGEIEHYYALVSDSGTSEFFIHNDAKIIKIDPKNAEQTSNLRDILLLNSTLVFYLKRSADKNLKSIMLPIFLENKDISPILLESIKASKIALPFGSKRRSIGNPSEYPN